MAMISAVDRLIFTLLFSVIIHAVILLGVSFNTTKPLTNQPLANLEITLVKQQTEQAPEEADYLAQADNQGGGETETKSPEPTPDPIPIIEQTQQPITPEVDVATITPIIAPTPLPEPILEPISVPAPEKTVKKPPAEVITQKTADRKVEVVVETTVESTDEIEVEPEAEPEIKPTVSARDLMQNARNNIASLDQQLVELDKSKLPKKRYISASTKEFAAAAYMKAWEKRIERIGNMNYPIEAKRQGLNGSLILSVDINPDGSVPPDGIVVSRSSGKPLLDNAAVKIARLGAPYAVVPDNVLQGNDMLTIVRTWKFETDKGLSAR